MKKVAVLLAPGFEEAEAIVTLDILRRLHIDVETLACAESRAVVSYHDIPMVADSTLSERQQSLFDAVVLPGGPQGSANLAANPAVIAFIARHDAAGKLICPICSAAARVLGAHGLLKGRRYVCSGDLWKAVQEGAYVDAPVVEDDNLISGKGLGHVFDFALTLSARLLGDDALVREQADHIYYPW
ncbi:DJ-1/PfpI family protein [Salmonella enterica]|uniref:DJ-1 family protein n=2 Tax=Salmonella enterica subsp. salamae TaxID=59202 RepID=A0A6C7DCG9_SALER|nr:DJ-1/PfpI family protein [Salmonella enterica]EAA8843745.1 DJ-1/PfpI family protein [Salmonella enterica subsp. enterica]EAA9932246.1 DJ-1/PfpI family protein [Salmonella enterica subsp. salamae]ECI2502034.1 DJ-1/PfpI family protein [Salmonella enterica subsp. enterica serovar Enteritidis]HAC6506635.1 DJ-1/PfpI family protein [Salmonella enterica subsp. salamae serovar 30:1,z28:z6]HCM1926665.1 DJ-1/PfpI family protein [Salmonella enterica subsp. salamae serovar 39:c:e,n,x]